MIELDVAIALALCVSDRTDDAAGSPPPALAFVYVEANVGGASGGHSGLRIGDQIYHYQRAPNGLLELERDDWNAFRHVYAGLQNRSLHLAWVRASAADVDRVAARFARAFVTGQRDLASLRRLQEDLEWWQVLGVGAPLPPLRGAGLLSATERGDAQALGLRVAVCEALGPAFLPEAILRLERELARAAPSEDSTELESVRERLLQREALLALEEGRALAPEAAIDEVDRSSLSPSERDALERFRVRLCAVVLELLVSQRPDRGFPLHVAIARHQAASRSLACDRLITLDAYPDNVPLSPGNPAEAAAAARVAARGLQICRQVREAVLPDREFREPLFALLEETISRCREAQRGARGEPMRICEGRLIPARGRSVATITPSFVLPDAEARRVLARARLAAFEETLHERYRYQLVERNCATELVRTLNESFAIGGADGVTAAAALGGRLDPGESFTFIPFVLDQEVNARLRIERVETIPSHRLRELQRLDDGDPGWLTALRESTTLTSTIYTPRAADGAFLFFTDDAALMRPIAGALNLGYGLAIGLGGIFAAPFDGASLLRSGLNGAFFSLPELVFCNVRKGSFRDLEPE